MHFRCQASDICFFLIHKGNIEQPGCRKEIEDLICIMKIFAQKSLRLVFQVHFFFFFLQRNPDYISVVLRESGLSGDFSSLLCSHCLLKSGVMRLVLLGCRRGQNTKCITQVCNRIIFAHNRPERNTLNSVPLFYVKKATRQ